MASFRRQTIAVLDASKLDQRSLSVVTPLQDLHLVIIHSSAGAGIVDTRRDAGVQVLLV